MTQDTAAIDSANLDTTQILVFAFGEGDVLPVGSRRTAVENFVQIRGQGFVLISWACAYIQNWSWLANACVEQRTSSSAFVVNSVFYADSVLAGEVPPRALPGTPPAAISHGIKNVETVNIFRGLPRSYSESFSTQWMFFQEPARLTPGVNILFSLDESSFTPTTPMGDHPVAWTHKMGNGVVVFNSVWMGGSYPQGISDSLIWGTMRYAAKDFVGCMDSNYVEYNPEATVTTLTPIDPPNPCQTPVPVLVPAKGGLNGISTYGGAISVSLTQAGRHRVEVVDFRGKRVFSASISGPRRLEIPGLQRGVYFVRVIPEPGRGTASPAAAVKRTIIY
jgi:hypothetical protein